jgi:HK97 family phage prohead protease
MPYDRRRNEDRCPTSRPIQVYNTETGRHHGCHATDDSAKEQMAALYAAEGGVSKDADPGYASFDVNGLEGSKSADLVEIKAEKEKGVFSAEFSVFGNLDSDGDIVEPGFFKSAFDRDPTPAVVWTHLWQIPPIGETLEAKETGSGAYGKGRLFLDEHEVARSVYAGIKSGALKRYSYSYRLTPDGFETKYDSGAKREVRHLTEAEHIWEWGPTLVGANDQTATIEPPKSAVFRRLLGSQEELSEAEWKALMELLEGSKLGARNNNKDRERLQAIHDYAVENGADCSGKSGGREQPTKGDVLVPSNKVEALLFAQPKFPLPSGGS